MVKFALRMPDDVHQLAQRLAEQDRSSLNEWIVQAIDREATRRALLAYNEYIKHSPTNSVERWQAQQDDIAEALGDS